MSRAANLLAGGWELTGIYTAQTGMFLTPFWTGDDPAGSHLLTRAPLRLSPYGQTHSGTPICPVRNKRSAAGLIPPRSLRLSPASSALLKA